MSKKPIIISNDELRKIIKERNVNTTHKYFSDKIATWKEVLNKAKEIAEKIDEHLRVDTIEDIRLESDDILYIEYTAGYDLENGETHHLICDSSYFFRPIEECKKDWDDMWDKIREAEHIRSAKEERDRRYQEFLKLKAEFEP